MLVKELHSEFCKHPICNWWSIIDWVKCKSSKEQGRLMSTAGTTPSLAKTPYWENTQPHIKTQINQVAHFVLGFSW